MPVSSAPVEGRSRRSVGLGPLHRPGEWGVVPFVRAGPTRARSARQHVGRALLGSSVHQGRRLSCLARAGLHPIPQRLHPIVVACPSSMATGLRLAAQYLLPARQADSSVQGLMPMGSILRRARCPFNSLSVVSRPRDRLSRPKVSRACTIGSVCYVARMQQLRVATCRVRDALRLTTCGSIMPRTLCRRRPRGTGI